MNWLAVDDDNGNILDGTPHMTALFSAFNRHGIACNAVAVSNGCAADLRRTGQTRLREATRGDRMDSPCRVPPPRVAVRRARRLGGFARRCRRGNELHRS
jgi:hypothetical protein